MVSALLRFLRMVVTVPFFELLGAGLVVAGVWVIADYGWALVTAGLLAFVKSLDLALEKK